MIGLLLLLLLRLAAAQISISTSAAWLSPQSDFLPLESNLYNYANPASEPVLSGCSGFSAHGWTPSCAGSNLTLAFGGSNFSACAAVYFLEFGSGRNYVLDQTYYDAPSTLTSYGLQTSVTIPLETWAHLCVTYYQQLSLYYNGALLASVSGPVQGRFVLGGSLASYRNWRLFHECLSAGVVAAIAGIDTPSS